MHRLRSTSFAALTLVSAVAALPARAAPTLSLLYTFKGAPDGSAPSGPPTAGPNGVVYGTTTAGGATGSGTVYELTPPSGGQAAWTETILSNLGAGDGIFPDNNIIVAKNGTLYGSAESGGQYSNGTVFQLTPPASAGAAWKFTRLHSFNKTTDGKVPGNLVAINDSSLFGPTGDDGHIFPNGTVFELSPPPLKTGAAVETTIATTGGTQVISNGVGGLYVLGYDGEYVNNLTPPAQTGGPWNIQTIFSEFNGGCPMGTLVIDTHHNLYATAMCGSSPTFHYAVVELLPPSSGSGGWVQKTIYPVSNSGLEMSDLTVDTSGSLYIVTAPTSSSYSTMLKLSNSDPGSNNWTAVNYFTFTTLIPTNGLSIDHKNNIYSVEYDVSSNGSVIAISP